MLYSQEWIEKQWTSTMFMDPRIHKRVVIIALACLNFPDRNILGRFQSAAAAKRLGKHSLWQEMSSVVQVHV